MTHQWAETIFQRKLGSRGAKIVWTALLLLFPLAYLGGSMLDRREVSRTAPQLRVGRAQATAIADEFLKSHQGIDASSWSSYVSLNPAEELSQYYRNQPGAAASEAQSFAPAMVVRVLLESSKEDYAEVDVDAGTAAVVGYDLSRVRSVAQAKPRDEQSSAAIATADVARIPNLNKLLVLGKPDVATVEPIKGAPCRKYAWHATSPQLPGLKFDVNSSVCGDRAVRRSVNPSVEPAYASMHPTGTPPPLKALLFVYAIYLIVAIFYSLYRYARRGLDGEISHRRTLLLAALITAALIMGLLTAIDEYVWGVYYGNGGVLWFPLILVSFVYAIGGALFAIAYEAGEGDVREMAPGKMTSLDALLRGKIFSSNVARSMVFGIAFAGWMFLLDWSINSLVSGAPSPITSDALKLPFFRYPILALIMGNAITVTLVPATALLLPLAFLHRNVHRPALRNTLLVIFALLGCSLAATRHTGMVNSITSVAVLSACILGCFLAMDFLAAIAAVMALSIAESMSGMVAISLGWERTGVSLAALAAVVVAIEIWSALRGREYHDEEVRPVYARNIAERQQLQAEVAAAREAQLHLLPKAAPEIFGASITASCVPARVVGGDFYDFFRLGESRLGIFIAEGGNRGIGSALNIALAKGFLMHTVRRGLAPHEIVRRLQQALGAFISGASSSTYVAYAIIDTAAGQLRYARTGEYPKILVSSKLVDERKVATSDGGNFVYEGAADLRGGDTVLLVTDGIARKVRLSGAGAADEVIRTLAKKRRSSELDDDLTAVVVRVERVGAAVGVVA